MVSFRICQKTSLSRKGNEKFRIPEIEGRINEQNEEGEKEMEGDFKDKREAEKFKLAEGEIAQIAG